MNEVLGPIYYVCARDVEASEYGLFYIVFFF